MNRAATIAATVIVVLFSWYLAFADIKPVPRATMADGGTDAGASFATPSVAVAAPMAAHEQRQAILVGFDAGNVTLTGLGLASDASMEPVLDAGVGSNGSATTTDGPRSVRFGVVLVTFEGAQGAPSSARSRGQARALAEQLAVEAARDFKSAVAKGDSGSMDDAGRMTRGILEPEAESALFRLAVGETSPPLETPRGYWIVKRLE